VDEKTSCIGATAVKKEGMWSSSRNDTKKGRSAPATDLGKEVVSIKIIREKVT
jgi:hypothetical protein